MSKTATGILIAIITFFIGVLCVNIYFSLSVKKEEISFSHSLKAEDSEEYAAYSAIINQISREKQLDSVVILDETIFFPPSKTSGENTLEEQVRHGKRYYSPASEETLTNFYLKNAAPVKLSEKFDLSVPYILIDENELGKTDEETLFYRKYSVRGMIKFSRVGFNSTGDQALVQFEFLCHPLCSFSEKVLLEKHFGFWEVKEKFGEWIS